MAYLVHNFFFLWGHFSALSADYIDTIIGASLVPPEITIGFAGIIQPGD